MYKYAGYVTLDKSLTFAVLYFHLYNDSFLPGCVCVCLRLHLCLCFGMRRDRAEAVVPAWGSQQLVLSLGSSQSWSGWRAPVHLLLTL